jgi:hypothetical protein
VVLDFYEEPPVPVLEIFLIQVPVLEIRPSFGVTKKEGAHSNRTPW